MTIASIHRQNERRALPVEFKVILYMYIIKIIIYCLYIHCAQSHFGILCIYYIAKESTAFIHIQSKSVS